MFQIGDRVRLTGGIGSFKGATGTIVGFWQGEVGYQVRPDQEFRYLCGDPVWWFQREYYELINEPAPGSYLELFF